jgi:hypothetical protein
VKAGNDPRGRPVEGGHLVGAILGATLALLGAGCATYITNSQAADFNQMVGTAASCFQASIREVRAMEAEDAIDEFLAGGGFKLEELAAQPRLKDDVAKAINSQVEFLVCYSAALRNLTSPTTTWSSSVAALNAKASQATADTGALATAEHSSVVSAAQVQKVGSELGSVANAVSTAGQAAITLYGEERSYHIAHSVDPFVQAYCSSLEDVLCADPDSEAPATGIAAILRADYEERLAALRGTFAPMATKPTEPGYSATFLERRAVAAQYVALRQNEADGVARILALRRVIAQIAAAHRAMAQKDDADFRQRIEATRDLVGSLSGGQPAAPPPQVSQPARH